MVAINTEWPVNLEPGDTCPDDWPAARELIDLDDEYPSRPCVGCGYCCISVPCYLSADGGYWVDGQCEMLIWSEKDKRYWCQLIIDDPLIGGEYDLAVGCGCCSPLNTWRNNIRERRKNYLAFSKSQASSR
jgi:hypothetical protein